MLNASEALLAQFLGVSVATVRSWEQRTRPVPPIARRYVDEIREFPELWHKRIRVIAGMGDRTTATPQKRRKANP
jgi:hypothetical protein